MLNFWIKLMIFSRKAKKTTNQDRRWPRLEKRVFWWVSKPAVCEIFTCCIFLRRVHKNIYYVFQATQQFIKSTQMIYLHKGRIFEEQRVSTPNGSSSVAVPRQPTKSQPKHFIHQENSVATTTTTYRHNNARIHAPSEEPEHKISVFRPLSPEDGNRSSFRNVVFSSL
jgi:hypothetical protein